MLSWLGCNPWRSTLSTRLCSIWISGFVLMYLTAQVTYSLPFFLKKKDCIIKVKPIPIEIGQARKRKKAHYGSRKQRFETFSEWKSSVTNTKKPCISHKFWLIHSTLCSLTFPTWGTGLQTSAPDLLCTTEGQDRWEGQLAACRALQNPTHLGTLPPTSKNSWHSRTFTAQL